MEMTEDIAELIGLMAGNGCIMKSGRVLSLAVSGRDRAVADKAFALLTQIKRHLASHLPTLPHFRTHISRRGPNKGQTGCYEICVYSKCVSDYISEWVVVHQGAKNKKFTNKFMALEEKYLLRAVQGLFTADGSASTSGVARWAVGLRGISLDLLLQAASILEDAGVEGRLYTTRRSAPEQTLFTLRIRPKAYALFFDTVGFMQESGKTTSLATIIAAR